MRADFSLSATTLSTTMISTTINHQPHQQHINTIIISPPFFSLSATLSHTNSTIATNNTISTNNATKIHFSSYRDTS